MFTLSETAHYLGRFIGLPERLEPQIRPWQDRNLPVWATQTAEFQFLRWANGASVLLIVPKTSMTETAIRLSRVVSRIAQLPALLVADLLPPQALGVLIREGIPHVLTNRAIYAPQLGTYYKSDLIKEEEAGVLPERLSTAAQKLVVYFLLRGHGILNEWRLNDWSAAFLTEGLEISPSSLSRGFHQLALLEFGHIVGNGPQKKFRFDDRNRAWGRLLQSEVVTVIRKGKIPGIPKSLNSYALSSDTALSRMSDLSPTDHYTIAMSQSQFSAWQSEGYMPRNVIGGFGAEPRAIIVEVWGDNPRFLSESDCVNPIELTLSMVRSRDPRVRDALVDMISKYSLDTSYLLETR